jgi:hypothetical protein
MTLAVAAAAPQGLIIVAPAVLLTLTEGEGYSEGNDQPAKRAAAAQSKG